MSVWGFRVGKVREVGKNELGWFVFFVSMEIVRKLWCVVEGV